MTIRVNEKELSFHLSTETTSYVIQINEKGYPLHLYWGNRLEETFDPKHLADFSYDMGLDRLPQEYPQYGTGDNRHPAYQAQLEDGTRATELVYQGYQVVKGKPALQGLPFVYAEQDNEAETLILMLKDEYSGLEVKLNYSVFTGLNAITRSTEFHNPTAQDIKLLRALSASVDFLGSDYDLLYLSGSWIREAQIQRRKIGSGTTRLESRKGASSHHLNPFVAAVEPGTDEEQGQVYSMSLVYSGNHVASAEVDQYFFTRLTIGINEFDFSWLLKENETFTTPEAVMVYSNEGLGGMSRTYHRLYRTRLSRGAYRDKERPILVNNWEATYFNFNADKLVDIAKTGSELGVELFVLDDGWFGARNDDTTSLGDWTEDRNKLPEGLENLAGRVNDLGVKFGLWVEPEMISPVSELYKQHPDWCMHVPGRRRTEARSQLILDLARPEVVDYLDQIFSALFSRVNVEYVKWDMNRNFAEIGSLGLPPERQMETAHRYILGLYDLLERLTSKFPHILFESCSSGGGRFDPGMLYYMPQTWASDNSDAIDRLKIQYGTSLVYPVSAMGAHVSAVPNHQVGRVTPLKTRGDVAMSGNFGYELDLTRFSDEEKEQVKEQIKLYKEHRPLIQQGDMYRLKSPFAGNDTSWMFVSPDKSEAIVFYFRVLADAHLPAKRVKLRGLDPLKTYTVQNGEAAETWLGDTLMNKGLQITLPQNDFSSTWFKLTAAE